MPENWKTYKLEDLVTKLGDGIHGTPKYSDNGEYYFINGNNLVDDKILIKPDTKRVSKNEYEKHKRELNDRTLLVSINGTIGKVAYYNNEKVMLGKSACYFNVKEDVDKAFIKQVISSKYFIDYLESNYTGSVIKNVSLKSMREMPINLPPLLEQKAIAKILSAIDDKIENNLAMNKTLEEMAMALYKHWFVDFGPFQEGNFIDSELGPIPEGWEVKKLGEIYNTTSGGTPSRKKLEYYENGTIPWVKSKELYGNFIIETEEKITELGLSKSSAKLVPEKTVMLAMYGATVGESSILSKRACSNQAICSIMQKELSYVYIFQFLRYFKNDILNQAVGSAQQNISQAIIKDLQIIVPPRNLNIFKEIEMLYSQIEENLIENQILTQLRDTLLPKLISGEVRLKEFENQVTEVL
ncbi:restriction endonuclease subunit S [Maribacter flavus]|uniref:Restriction endonuclease subunit S n=1 Tax=Maribacter flavus TaxID=1658664 RepID=A0A5B2U1G7_9FLAO|nr:restriction endonuclease subunit S [Maribacter flavus]KAA2219905.1 restriction endonuclease subunit S [Maribacter flavus]